MGVSGLAGMLALAMAGVVATLTLSGCGCGHDMMPAPLGNRRECCETAAVAWRDSVPADRRTTFVPIFYATNREPQAPSGAGAAYGSSPCEAIRVGSASVRIGDEGWDWERLASETTAGGQPRMTVTRITEYGQLDDSADRFCSDVNAALAACPRKDVFVYIPGINIDFEMVMQRTAEFSHHLGRGGAFVAYAWPAHAHPFSFDDDYRGACQSVAGFTGFLRALSARTDARRIHLLTSSAGAPLVSGALTMLHSEAGGGEVRLGQVVYAASTQEVAGFRSMLGAGDDAVCEHITVYGSSSDLGLMLSRYLAGGGSAIGRLPATMTDEDAKLLREHAAKVSVVDVTGAVDHAGRGDIWAHRYWYANPWVSSDIVAVLKEGATPAARGLIAAREGALWEFPDDYPERLRRGTSRDVRAQK